MLRTEYLHTDYWKSFAGIYVVALASGIRLRLTSAYLASFGCNSRFNRNSPNVVSCTSEQLNRQVLFGSFWVLLMVQKAHLRVKK